MLINLLSTNNQISFNKILAHTLGLRQAVYIAEVMNINEKAIRKNKIDNGFFTLDRKYLTDRTTLLPQEQQEIEAGLAIAGILVVDENNKNHISLNIDKLVACMIEPDEDIKGIVADSVSKKQMKEAEKQAREEEKKRIAEEKAAAKLTKEEAKKAAREAKEKAKAEKALEKAKVREEKLSKARAVVQVSDDQVKEAYYSWIESVYDKFNYISVASVIDAQRIINNYNINKYVDIALDIIRIAQINAWRDMQYALNRYLADKKNNINTFAVNQVAPVNLENVEVGEAF